MKILQELVWRYGIAAAAETRLISKAWSAAFTEISVDLVCVGEHQLLTLAKLLPRIDYLLYNITSAYGCPVQLEALRTFTELTKLELRSPGKSQTPFKDRDDLILPLVDLGCLPATLLHLELDAVTIIPGSMTNLQCTGLEHLTCKDNDLDMEIRNLLPCLTALEVSHAIPDLRLFFQRFLKSCSLFSLLMLLSVILVMRV